MALGRVGAGQPGVVAALLATLQHAHPVVFLAAARALGQMEIKDPDTRQVALVVLFRQLYERDDDICKAALEAIREQLEGRSLPGAPTSVQRLRARRRRLQQGAFWLLVVAALLGLGLLGTWLTGVLDANSFLLRFLGVVAVLLAFAAGVTQIVGWSFRDFGEKGEKRKQRS